jgi:cytochrome c biogenesis protein
MEDRSSEDLIKRYASVISKRFKKHEVQKNEEGFYVFAEKQRWTRLGAYIVHTSVLLMLIGSLVGSIFGFDGFVNIPVGEKVSQIRLNKSHKLQPLDFEIQCDDFKVSFYESGAPKEYRSTLTIFENQRQTLKRDIIVNKPLRYRGINIFQSSYGKVPFENPDGNKSADLKSKKIELSIFNNNTGMSYSKETMMGEEIILPEGKGSFMLKNFSANATFHDQNIGAAFIGVLTEDKAEPKEVLLPIRYPSFDKMRNGYFVFSVENIEDLLNETETGYRYYTGLQVTRDPGVWIIYAGFVFMIFGCFVSFFMAHQQIFIEARKNGKKTSILISGISNKNPAGMKIKTEKLAKALKEGL